MNLKDELRKLSQKYKDELMLAFEAGTQHHVVFKETAEPTCFKGTKQVSWFIGVHLVPTDRLIAVETEGDWTLGYVG